jgi:hypothetical protein
MVRENAQTSFRGPGSPAQSFRETRRCFLFRPDARQIRLHAKGELRSDYHANLGKGFDEKCVEFLRVDYDGVVERVKQGGTDKEMLDWCFIVGRKPEDDIYVWNEFMRKSAGTTKVSEMVVRRKAAEE